MNATQLLAHFDRLSEAPGAVPRLRRFILDLAVRGKLVEQDPDDEPAAALLKKIQTEKVKRVKSGEIRNPRDLDFQEEDAVLFTLPRSWRWVRLSEVGAIIGGGTPPSGDSANFTDGGKSIAWLTPADLGKHKNLYISHGARDLTQKGFQSGSATLMPKGSVLFTSRAPIGYTAIAANEISTNQGFKSVVPYLPQCSRYIAIYLQAFAPWVDSKATGTTFKEVSGKIVSSLPFPLPPLAEQHRIVARVDELMALCDQLEAAQQERERRRDSLVAASLQRLNAPTAAPQDFARFHLHHLPRLTTRPEHIKQLRQTMLNLAVRGRLVQQDVKDEPAAELLKRIQAEKAKLVHAGLIPKPKAVTEDAALSFPTPMHWQAVRLGDVCNLVTSGSRGWAEFYAESGPKFVRAQNIRFGRLRLDPLACVNPPARSEGARTQLQQGDLLIVITGAGVTNPALLDRDLGEAYISQHVALVRPTLSVLSRWFLLCLMAGPGGRDELVERAYGAGKPGLNLDNIRSLNTPLPPLAEQHRIVAKVDALMALCDQLEAQLATTQTDSRRLLEAVLNETLA